ncbi:MAG: energy transducer TonB [Candidatus Obscuribacterales bacterium]|nr:energy transducer TonB [Candidatus Obscuribacterales bacterium]
MGLKLAMLILSLFLAVCPLEAREFSLGTDEEAKMIDAQVLEAPSPEIPAEYQSEAFKSNLTARFNISAEGKVEVKLLDSSGVEEIDKLVLSTLKKWRFKPASLDDRPVASNRKLKIELEVE